MKEEIVVKNLREVKEIFGKFGIRYWLDCGTLLGAVRDGKMIEWDQDIDLGTLDGNLKKINSAISQLEKKGFCVIINREGEFFIRIERFGCSIDLYLYYTKGENAFNIQPVSASLISGSLGVLYLLLSPGRVNVRPKFRCIVKVFEHFLSPLPPKSKKLISNVVWPIWRRSCKTALLVIPKRYFEKLKIIKFYGTTFNIPSDAEGYLRYKYGKDWRTPKKEWKWWKEDGTVKTLTRRM